MHHYLPNKPKRPTPNPYREPFKPSAAEALRQRELAKRYARVIAPDPYIVALLHASNAPITHVSEPAPAPTPAAPIRSADGLPAGWARSDRNGDEAYARSCGKYRVWQSGGGAWVAGGVARNGGGSTGLMPGGIDAKWSQFASAADAMSAVDALLSRLTPAPQPAWREATEPEEALRLAGFTTRGAWNDDTNITKGPAVKGSPMVRLQAGVWLAWTGAQHTAMTSGARYSTVHEALEHALGEPVTP